MTETTGNERMHPWNQYLRPTSIEQAVAQLESAYPGGRVVAGGTDLLLDIQQGREPPVDTLVDITGIEKMASVDVRGDLLYLGAAATHHAILSDPRIQDRATCLAEACGVIGGPQVRNVATIGGNVAHGLPAADGTIGLLALEAEAEIAGVGGRSWQRLESLFQGPGKTTFDRRRQILTRFRFILSAGDEASAFYRVMRPQGVAIAILNMACWLKIGGDGLIRQARIAVGPSGPVPRRATNSEEALTGSRAAPEELGQVRQTLLEESKLRTSRHRATKEYREHLIQVLVERTIPVAYERAAEKVQGSKELVD